MFLSRQKQLDDQWGSIDGARDSWYNHFSKNEMVTQAKYEVLKDKRADKLAESYLQLNNRREKERDDSIANQKETMRREADEINRATLRQHRAAKQLAMHQKNLDNHFHNRLTDLSTT